MVLARAHPICNSRNFLRALVLTNQNDHILPAQNLPNPEGKDCKTEAMIAKILWLAVCGSIAGWAMIGGGDASIFAIFLIGLMTMPAGLLVYVLASLALGTSVLEESGMGAPSESLIHLGVFLSAIFLGVVRIVSENRASNGKGEEPDHVVCSYRGTYRHSLQPLPLLHSRIPERERGLIKALPNESTTTIWAALRLTQTQAFKRSDSPAACTIRIRRLCVLELAITTPKREDGRARIRSCLTVEIPTSMVMS